MVQCEIFCRVIRIQYGNYGGTCFTIESHGEQFLVTAKHLFKELYPDSANIKLLIGTDYRTFAVDIRYPTEKNVDIAVMRLKTPRYLTPVYENRNTTEGLVLGQVVYFVGFPFQYDSILNRFPGGDKPIPFVKQACLSAILKDDIGTIILDGINNPGFSGGPVCYKIIGSDEKTMRILGVVSSYRFNESPVFEKDGQKTENYVKENTGIIVVSDIKYAMKIAENWT